MYKFRVSIFMLTYNQEKFIAETIKSVLMQQTDFPFQLVIGEDGSSDNTRKICQEFAEKYGEKIKLLSSEKNIGLIHNFIRTYKICDGEYVAILDGDDYWTDPFKLKKQVDFLDSHPDHSIVFTRFKKLYPGGRIVSKNYSEMKSTTYFTDIVRGNYICSATVMFRNKSHQNDYPQWIDQFPYGDWPLYLWKTRNEEKIGFLKEETAVYRMEIGVSEKLKKTHSDIVQVNTQILNHAYKDPNFTKRSTCIKKSLVNHKISLMASYIREKKWFSFFLIMPKLFFKKPIRVVKTCVYVCKRSFLTRNYF